MDVVVFQHAKQPAKESRRGSTKPFTRRTRPLPSTLGGVPHAESSGPPPSGWLQPSPSRPLDEAERQAVHPYFGDLTDDVNVHEGGVARDMNEKLAADAFVVGNDMYFPARESRSEGQALRLLAHETSHVAEQRNLSQPRIQMSRPCENPQAFTPTTREAALAELTDTPCHTFAGESLGDFNGKQGAGYPFTFRGKNLKLKVSKKNRWFGNPLWWKYQEKPQSAG